MFGKLFSDRASVPELDRFMERGHRPPAGRPRRRAGRRASAPAAGGPSGCARCSGWRVDFWTWRRLTDEGLDDEAAAELMAASVTSCAAG